MDIKNRFDTLKERYTEHKNRRNYLQSDINELDEELHELEETIGDLKNDRDTLDRSIEVIKELIENIFHEKVEQYKSLIQRGLDVIFDDRNYDFKVDVDNRGHQKTAKLLYREDDTEFVNLDDGSGAVRGVVDLLSRIFLIHITGRRKFLILDESLSSIAEEYIGNVVDFLDTLSSEMGFDILAISHAKRLIEKADTVYEVENGNIRSVENGSK